MYFFRDKVDTLCMAPCKYIEKICDSFEQMFGNRLKQNIMSPMENWIILN